VDDAFLHKTVAAVVAAVTAAQKPPGFFPQPASVVRGDVSNANPESAPSGVVPQGGDLNAEPVMQPVEPQAQAQEKILQADVPQAQSSIQQKRRRSTKTDVLDAKSRGT
jgi:hypothetical protein